MIAVFGATGRQGGAVARSLLGQGVSVRALTRSPDADAARALRDAGADIAAADPADPDSLRAAFADVSSAYLMTARGDDETAQGVALVDAAVDAEVPFVVYSSVGGAERDTGIPHFETKWEVERHLQRSGLRATVIRPVFFMDNLQPSVEDDEVVVRMALPADVAVQMIAPTDIGRAAAGALQDAEAVPGGSVEIAGDERTGDQIAQAYAQRTDLPVRYEALPLDALDDEDSRSMFAWFASGAAYDGDFDLTASLVTRDGGPPPDDLPAHLERAGWQA